MPETLEKMKKAFPCIRNLIDNGFYTFLFEIDSFLTAKVKEVMRRIVIEFCQEHNARNSATIIVIFFSHQLTMCKVALFAVLMVKNWSIFKIIHFFHCYIIIYIFYYRI